MNLNDLSHPLVIAHRGYKGLYPENTLASFDAAIRHGAEMIELDITLTKDRKVVVIHDDTVDRTTNGTGNVRTFPLKKLQRLDAGSWFDSRFSGERIPTLADVLDLAKDNISVNIEIKSSAWEFSAPEDAIEKQVLMLVRDKKMTDQILVSSFEKNLLYNLRSMDKTLPLSFLTDYKPDKNVFTTLKDLNAYSWNQDIRFLRDEDVKFMQANGFKVMTYTVNTKDMVKKCMDMGCDGFFTDFPDILHNR